MQGKFFKEKDQNNATTSWIIDLLGTNSNTGGVGVPIYASKIVLKRSPALKNIVTGNDQAGTNTNIYTLNVAEIKIEGFESDATDSGMYIPPPYSLSLNESASNSHEKYVIDVLGSFANYDIFIYDNENCSGTPIARKVLLQAVKHKCT